MLRLLCCTTTTIVCYSHCTMLRIYIFGGPKPNFWAVTPSSENKKDAQRSCDQFPCSIAPRWLFSGPFTKDLVFYVFSPRCLQPEDVVIPCSLGSPTVFIVSCCVQIARTTTRLTTTTARICHDSRLRILTTTRLTTAGCPRPRLLGVHDTTHDHDWFWTLIIYPGEGLLTTAGG